MRRTKYRLPGSLCSAQCTESLVSLSWGVDDDGLKSSKSVQMFAHQLFGSDATVVDSCIMIAAAHRNHDPVAYILAYSIVCRSNFLIATGGPHLANCLTSGSALL